MVGSEHPDLADVTLADALRALADPTRLRIIRCLLAVERLECSAVYLPLGLTKSNATFHFRVLRQCGLMRRTREGRQQYAALRRADFDQRFPELLDVVLARAAGECGASPPQ